MPATDDEIREKYLERAIRELNQLTREIQSCEHCPRGNLMPVLGSGHPQADIMLLKFAPMPSEIEEGVAFYGRAGQRADEELQAARHRPARRLRDGVREVPGRTTPTTSAPECRARVLEEIAIVQPRIVVVMGEEALEELNALRRAAGRRARAGSWARSSALTPAVRRALRAGHRRARSTTRRAKREFWGAFRALGEWYADFPPY